VLSVSEMQRIPVTGDGGPVRTDLIRKPESRVQEASARENYLHCDNREYSLLVRVAKRQEADCACHFTADAAVGTAKTSLGISRPQMPWARSC